MERHESVQDVISQVSLTDGDRAAILQAVDALQSRLDFRSTIRLSCSSPSAIRSIPNARLYIAGFERFAVGPIAVIDALRQLTAVS
jgi:hypothetical protein